MDSITPPIDENAIAWAVETISPDTAREMLHQSFSEHKLSRTLIKSYARDMAAGVWKVNGQPIIISDQQRVLDGRVRLAACIEASTPFRTLVIRNISEGHFDTIDAVRRRTFGDILTILKEPSGRALAGALTFIWRYYSGAVERSSGGVSAQQVLDVLRVRPTIRESARKLQGITHVLPLGLSIALHHLMSRADDRGADEFFDLIADKSFNVPDHPATALKRAIGNLKAEGGAISQPFVAALTIKAWNAFIAGEKRSLLRWRQEGARAEAFPLIDGLPADDGSDIISASGTSAHQAPIASSRPILPANSTVEKLHVWVGNVTPEQAGELLAHNDGNRGIADAVVDKYQRDISNGNWALNGQTIKVGSSGRLLDGQHRCMACVHAQKPFPAIIVRGVDDDTFDTLDLGARRSLAVILERRGEKNASALAAAAKLLWLHSMGRLQHKTLAPTASEILDLLDQHPGLRESMRQVLQKTRDVLQPSVAVCFHYLFAQKAEKLADEFFDRLGDGANLNVDSPILILRNRLLKDRADRKRSLADAERIALLIKAWNAFKGGERITQLKWQNSGPRKERMPEIA